MTASAEIIIFPGVRFDPAKTDVADEAPAPRKPKARRVSIKDRLDEQAVEIALMCAFITERGLADEYLKFAAQHRESAEGKP